MAVRMEDTEISVWAERDRMHVCLSHKNGDTIVEWWDGAVDVAVSDGFISPRDWHRTTFTYAAKQGLLKPGMATVTIKPVAVGWVAENPGIGVYCGWRKGGLPIWSSEVEARGAYVFDSEKDARDLLETEGVEDGRFMQIEIEPVEGAHERTTFASCENAGLNLFLPAHPPTP